MSHEEDTGKDVGVGVGIDVGVDVGVDIGVGVGKTRPASLNASFWKPSVTRSSRNDKSPPESMYS